MDARRLRYFAAVVEQGGFAQAAAALHVTQPAVSMAVRKLEEDLGNSLLERQSKPMEMTPFGRAVYGSWQVHQAEHRRLIRELRNMADLNTAHVTVVLGATFPMGPVVAALESLRRRYPHFRLSVSMGSYSGNLPSVLDGSADFILSQLPSKADARIVHEPLIADRFRPVCRRTHPLAGRAGVTRNDIVLHPWVGGGPFDAFLPGWTDAFACGGLVAPEPVLQTTSIIATMVALLGHDYLAMLPEGYIADELMSGEMSLLPVDGLEWQQTKGASWLQGRSLSPGAVAYIEELKQQLEKGPLAGGAVWPAPP